ncbi:MAG TPA: DUF5777 family beta-barrel protein [Flavipsychrobacter sp.]|nr:DUF5777 family beta-barrel protein [Flavipsychrobacter sp.]
MRKALFLFVLTLLTTNLFAQNDTSVNDLSRMLDTGKGNSNNDYVLGTFKSTRLINGHTVENLGAGTLDFRISHRFGQLNQGAQNFFGLDDATTKLGFDYGITDWLMVGVGRSTLNKEYDGFAKVRLLRQKTHAMPVSLSYIGVISLQDMPVPSLPQGEKYYFSNRLYYVNQLLIARKFNDWLSLQVMPTIIHYNLVDSANDKNNILSVGVGGRIKVSHRIAITGEYYYVIPGTELHGQYYNSLSVGIDIETGGHVFQLFFTNSPGITERTFIAQTTDSWAKGQIHFGFNISRVFTIVQPKGFENSRNKIW